MFDYNYFFKISKERVKRPMKNILLDYNDDQEDLLDVAYVPDDEVSDDDDL